MSDNSITKFADEIIDRFSLEITDQVFLMIENDRVLLQEYLRLISDKKLDPVNQAIGKAVKKRYQLENATTREGEPKSKLIKSHQEF